MIELVESVEHTVTPALESASRVFHQKIKPAFSVFFLSFRRLDLSIIYIKVGGHRYEVGGHGYLVGGHRP